jgi:hypothetical protein
MPHGAPYMIGLFMIWLVPTWVDWDLVSVVQNKGEPLREFIQRFCNKRNIILEVNHKSIIVFFKKGHRNSSLIRRLTIKTPRTSEEMLVIANKYAVAEEATLDNRDSKTDKELGQSDRPSTSKSNDRNFLGPAGAQGTRYKSDHHCHSMVW